MLAASHAEALIVVEGESDRQAVLRVAALAGRDLASEHVAVVALGGATKIEAFLSRLDRSMSPHVVGLCDERERNYFERVIDADDLWVCDVDLEDELIRAIGDGEIEDFIESQGERKAFRIYQKQPVQRGWTLHDQVHRFCGTLGGRKIRYAPAMVDWLGIDRVPKPLRSVVDAV